MNRKQGIFVLVVGFLLSPISWWNDIIINLPISYLLAIPFGLINRNLFFPCFIAIYWLTNIAGLLLMHLGVKTVTDTKHKKLTKKDILYAILISIGYTVLILILVKYHVIRFPTGY